MFSGEFGDQPEASRKARATSEAMVRTMGVKIHAMRPPLPMIAVVVRVRRETDRCVG